MESNNTRRSDLPNLMLLPVLEVAETIEERLSLFLKPTPVALYTKRSLSPVFHLDPIEAVKMEEYASGPVPVQEIQKLMAGRNLQAHRNQVTDKDGRFVFHVSEKLYSYPHLPVRGLNMVKELVSTQIEQHLRWCKIRKNTEDVLSKYILDKYTDMDRYVGHIERHGRVEDFVYSETSWNVRECIEHVTRYMQTTAEFVDDFTKAYRGQDEWGVYDLRLDGSTLTITYQGDFRVIDWMQRHGKQYE